MTNIYNDESDTLVSGTSGNDFISSQWGVNVTILGGDGSDTIETSGSLVTVAGGASNDTIIGFSDTDTLAIASASHSTAVSGKNLNPPLKTSGGFFMAALKNFLPIRQENLWQARIAEEIRNQGARELWQ